MIRFSVHSTFKKSKMPRRGRTCNVWSRDTIFRPISKRFCICGIGKSNGQVFILSELPLDFDTTFNSVYRSYNTILVRLLDGNETQPILKRRSTFVFKQSDFSSETCRKDKSYCVTTPSYCPIINDGDNDCFYLSIFQSNFTSYLHTSGSSPLKQSCCAFQRGTTVSLWKFINIEYIGNSQQSTKQKRFQPTVIMDSINKYKAEETIKKRRKIKQQ